MLVKLRNLFRHNTFVSPADLGIAVKTVVRCSNQVLGLCDDPHRREYSRKFFIDDGRSYIKTCEVNSHALRV